MLDYNVKIGLIAMRRNTTDRPRGTFLTWYSAEQRGKKFVKYIEENFKTENVSFVDNFCPFAKKNVCLWINLTILYHFSLFFITADQHHRPPQAPQTAFVFHTDKEIL